MNEEEAKKVEKMLVDWDVHAAPDPLGFHGWVVKCAAWSGGWLYAYSAEEARQLIMSGQIKKS